MWDRPTVLGSPEGLEGPADGSTTHVDRDFSGAPTRDAGTSRQLREGVRRYSAVTTDHRIGRGPGGVEVGPP